MAINVIDDLKKDNYVVEQLRARLSDRYIAKQGKSGIFAVDLTRVNSGLN